MSGANIEEVKKQEPVDNLPIEGDNPKEDPKVTDENTEKSMPSPQQEADVIKKKYGGIIPKKPPLISKDHERAYFDSADWALGKQGAQKPKGPLEALRPKLQPSAHHQARSRRSAYAPADGDGEDDDGHDPSPLQDQSTSTNEHDPSKEESTASAADGHN